MLLSYLAVTLELVKIATMSVSAILPTDTIGSSVALASISSMTEGLPGCYVKSQYAKNHKPLVSN